MESVATDGEQGIGKEYWRGHIAASVEGVVGDMPDGTAYHQGGQLAERTESAGGVGTRERCI